MTLKLNYLFFMTLLILLTGCGGGGSGSTGQAQSTTVALQAQVKTGTSMAVFSSYSNSKWGPNMNFTLKSVINPNAGTMASDINITSEVISYEYSDAIVNGIPAVSGSAVSLLNLPPFTYNLTMIVPAGGTYDLLNLPVLSPAQKLYLISMAPLVLTNDYINYKVKVTFNGYEVKNGSNVSVSVLGNVFIYN